MTYYSPVTVSANAGIAAYLGALNAVARAGKITSIALTDVQPVRIANAQVTSGTVAVSGSGVTLDVGLAPTSGVEETANFQYGIDQLPIDLQGLAATRLAAFDTSVNGQHAIALADGANLTHGIVLLGMGTNAADLMAHHLAFATGSAMAS